METPTEQPTNTPEQPEEPEHPHVDLKKLFDVSIKVPTGWRNSYSATVRIKITPSSDQQWHTDSLNRLATEAGMEEARTALNDVCGALYTMRQHIKKLQAAHLKHLLDSSETDEPPEADD